MERQTQPTLNETLTLLKVDEKIMHELEVLKNLIQDATSKHQSKKQQLADNNELLRKIVSMTDSAEHALKNHILENEKTAQI